MMEPHHDEEPPAQPQNNNNANSEQVLSPERIAASRARQQQQQQLERQQQQQNGQQRAIARDRFIWKFSRVETLLFDYLVDLYMMAFDADTSTNPHRKKQSTALSKQNKRSVNESGGRGSGLLSSRTRVIPSNPTSTSTSTTSASSSSTVTATNANFNSVVSPISEERSPNATEYAEKRNVDNASNMRSLRDAVQFSLLDSGFVAVVCMALFFLQFIGLVLLPSLPWDRTTGWFLMSLYALRSFHVQVLLETENIVLGQLLNYYIPFIVSFICTILTFALPLATFFIRNRFLIKTLSVYVQVLPALIIPVLTGYINTMSCSHGLIEHEVNVIFPECFSGFNILFLALSILLFLPFCVMSVALVSLHYEWRPDAYHILARPHSRYDTVMYSGALFITCMTTAFERYSIFVLFVDFVVVLAMLGMHIYYMQYYRTLVNQLVMVFLFAILFACMNSVLITTFMMIFSSFSDFISPFSGMILIAGITASIPAGIMLPRLRVGVMGSMIHDPSPLQRMLYQLDENEVLVPRGDFEVEMAARIIKWINGVALFNPDSDMMAFITRRRNRNSNPRPRQDDGVNDDDLESNRRPRICFTSEYQQLLDDLLVEDAGNGPNGEEEGEQQDTNTTADGAADGAGNMNSNSNYRNSNSGTQISNNATANVRRGYRDVVLDKVDEMYRTALEVVHARSINVHINYATFCAHCLGLVDRAIGIISMAENEMSSFAPDIRMLLYVRKKVWMRLSKHQRQQQQKQQQSQPSQEQQEEGQQLQSQQSRPISTSTNDAMESTGQQQQHQHTSSHTELELSSPRVTATETMQQSPQPHQQHHPQSPSVVNDH